MESTGSLVARTMTRPWTLHKFILQNRSRRNPGRTTLLEWILQESLERFRVRDSTTPLPIKRTSLLSRSMKTIVLSPSHSADFSDNGYDSRNRLDPKLQTRQLRLHPSNGNDPRNRIHPHPPTQQNTNPPPPPPLPHPPPPNTNP